MTLKESIIELITGNAYLSATVTESSNLYTDLGFDSLSFINLLVMIEDRYAVSFDIDEMERCIQVNRLIGAIENKLKESGGND